MDVLFQSGAGYEARTRFPASHEPPGGASREPCAHLRSKCASRMGVGSKFFASDECRILRSSRGRGCLRGKPLRVSFRFSIKVAAGGRFAAQIENAPKRSTTRVGGVSFCRVFTEKMQTCSHCSTIVFKINLEDIDPLLCHQRLFHLVVRRQFWILNVHCQI